MPDVWADTAQSGISVLLGPIRLQDLVATVSSTARPFRRYGNTATPTHIFNQALRDGCQRRRSRRSPPFHASHGTVIVLSGKHLANSPQTPSSAPT